MMQPFWILFILLVAASAKDKGEPEQLTMVNLSHSTTVGLNCSESEECEDEPPCPSDSTLDTEVNECICTPGHCSALRCPFKAKKILAHNSSKTPGDCCDVYECISETEVNCTGVVCPADEEECPPDSNRLPRTMKEGDCCAVSHGCECFLCSQPSPCPHGQTSKVIRPGNGKPGSCCPIYECHPLKESKDNVCIYNKEEKPEGSKWRKNQCSECTCVGGAVQCTVNCPPIPSECTSTTLPKGECCPICVNDPVDVPGAKPGGCMERGIIYQNGQSWEEDDCTFCTCKEGSKVCQAGMCQQNENTCKPPCELLLSNDGSNTICHCEDGINKCPSLTSCAKKCRHGYKTAKNGCPVCKCDHCKPVDNCKKRCPHGLQTNDRGCPICKCKPSSAINESIDDKPANTSCSAGGGILKDDGEAWFDGCHQCYCYSGKEMCTLVSCPKLSCPDPIISKNACCPTCPGNETRAGMHMVCYGPGGLKKEGETWKYGCMECICHGGRIMCHQEECPPILCAHPLPPTDGSCCPTKCPHPIKLPEKNIIGCGADRSAGSTFRQDRCTSCVCINGIADCYSQECDQVDASCKHPLQVKNSCCPICIDSYQEENTCQMANVTFSMGDVWEVKKCERCTCGPGRVITCTQTVCESGCSNTNPCCPKCPSNFGPDGGGIRGFKLWMILIFVSTLVTFAFAFCTRYYCQKRHRFKICDPVPRNCNYMFVATYENPSSPHKGPV